MDNEKIVSIIKNTEKPSEIDKSILLITYQFYKVIMKGIETHSHKPHHLDERCGLCLDMHPSVDNYLQSLSKNDMQVMSKFFGEEQIAQLIFSSAAFDDGGNAEVERNIKKTIRELCINSELIGKCSEESWELLMDIDSIFHLYIIIFFMFLSNFFITLTINQTQQGDGFENVKRDVRNCFQYLQHATFPMIDSDLLRQQRKQRLNECKNVLQSFIERQSQTQIFKDAQTYIESKPEINGQLNEETLKDMIKDAYRCKEKMSKGGKPFKPSNPMLKTLVRDMDHDPALQKVIRNMGINLPRN